MMQRSLLCMRMRSKYVWTFNWCTVDDGTIPIRSDEGLHNWSDLIDSPNRLADSRSMSRLRSQERSVITEGLGHVRRNSGNTGVTFHR